MKDSIKELLPREIENENLVKLLNEFSQTIDQFVNFGTYILDWDIANLKGGDEQMPVILLFRNFLELLDSVSILVKKSSIDPCKVILRTALETSLGVEYILKENTIDRAMSFLVCSYYKELKVLEKHDITTEHGKQFRSVFFRDENLNGVTIPTPDNLTDKIRGLKELLQSTSYIKVKTEYERTKKSDKKSPEWYRLFGGPGNIKELCDKLKIPVLYEVFYRNLSDSIHGNDIIHGKIAESSNGNIDIYQIRFYKDAQEVTSLALLLTVRLYDIYISERLPQRKLDFKNWFQTVYEPFSKITNKNKILTII